MKKNILFIFCCAFSFLLNAQDGSSPKKQTSKNPTVKTITKTQQEGVAITSADKRAEYEALKRNEVKNASVKKQNNPSIKTELSTK